ncbi:unnamed protein product [Acidithrix sp. C25]|nr:unnamed protein product [Acidithrix sp. C25]
MYLFAFKEGESLVWLSSLDIGETSTNQLLKVTLGQILDG